MFNCLTFSGCCGCCGSMSLPSLPSFGCGGQMSGGGCGASAPAPSSCSGGGTGYSIGGLGGGGGCSHPQQQALQPFSNPRPLPSSGYAIPPPILPTFSPQLPPAPIYSVAPASPNPIENSVSPFKTYIKVLICWRIGLKLFDVSVRKFAVVRTIFWNYAIFTTLCSPAPSNFFVLPGEHRLEWQCNRFLKWIFKQLIFRLKKQK